MADKFPNDHHRVGQRPLLPFVLTWHSVDRYRVRFAPGATLDQAQAQMSAQLARAVWAGKTRDGRLLLECDSVAFVVQRWEYKLRVLTVLPTDAHGVTHKLAADADVRPRNPTAKQLGRTKRSRD